MIGTLGSERLASREAHTLCMPMLQLRHWASNFEWYSYFLQELVAVYEGCNKAAVTPALVARVTYVYSFTRWMPDQVRKFHALTWYSYGGSDFPACRSVAWSIVKALQKHVNCLCKISALVQPTDASRLRRKRCLVCSVGFN